MSWAVQRDAMHMSGPNANDTSADARDVQMEGWRRMSPTERVAQACQLSASLRSLAMAAIRRRHPLFDEAEVRLKFIELTYGPELCKAVRAHLREHQLA